MQRQEVTKKKIHEPRRQDCTFSHYLRRLKEASGPSLVAPSFLFPSASMIRYKYRTYKFRLHTNTRHKTLTPDILSNPQFNTNDDGSCFYMTKKYSGLTTCRTRVRSRLARRATPAAG